MKKYFLLLVLFPLAVLVRGNVTPEAAMISEILVDGTGNWTIELGFSDFFFGDSIVIESSSGRSAVSNYELIPGSGYPFEMGLAVITNANLHSPISVNPGCDMIKVISYYYDATLVDSVAFGNYPGSGLNCIRTGESVSYIDEYWGTWSDENGFCMDKSPSIGLPNDTTDISALLSGKIYNPAGGVFTEGDFYIANYGIQFNISPDGSFSGYVLARRLVFDTVYIGVPGSPTISGKYAIVPVDICLRPDSACQLSIYTTSRVTTPVLPLPAFKKVTVSPNPFTGSVTFYFNLNGISLYDMISLEILTMEGKQILQVRLADHPKEYQWTPDITLPPGTLIYKLMADDRCVESGKVIKLQP
jgi:hypothetical protein